MKLNHQAPVPSLAGSLHGPFRLLLSAYRFRTGTCRVLSQSAHMSTGPTAPLPVLPGPTIRRPWSHAPRCTSVAGKQCKRRLRSCCLHCSALAGWSIYHSREAGYVSPRASTRWRPRRGLPRGGRRGLGMVSRRRSRVQRHRRSGSTPDHRHARRRRRT